MKIDPETEISKIIDDCYFRMKIGMSRVYFQKIFAILEVP